jgi:hypothetical protein
LITNEESALAEERLYHRIGQAVENNKELECCEVRIVVGALLRPYCFDLCVDYPRGKCADSLDVISGGSICRRRWV